MLKIYLFSCALCLYLLPSSGQLITTTVSMKKYRFEKICREDYGLAIGNYFRTRDQHACGVKCASFVACKSFMYDVNNGLCIINSENFDNRTNVGCSHTVDYAEDTTNATGSSSSDPDPVPGVNVTCEGSCTNDISGFRLCDGGGPGVCDTSQGRLEVMNGQWGSICDDYWMPGDPESEQNANVACGMFGYSSGVSKPSAFYGLGLGAIWLDDIRCTGTETTILDCPRKNWGDHGCSHSQDVGVMCS